MPLVLGRTLPFQSKARECESFRHGMRIRFRHCTKIQVWQETKVQGKQGKNETKGWLFFSKNEIHDPTPFDVNRLFGPFRNERTLHVITRLFVERTWIG